MKKVCFICNIREGDPGVDERSFTFTNDDKTICWGCAEERNFCEICGSITEKGVSKEEADRLQPHYDELCFK